jgi:hypothetical protein
MISNKRGHTAEEVPKRKKKGRKRRMIAFRK